MYNDYLFPFKAIPLLLIKTRTLKNQKHLIFLTLKNYLLQETFLPQSTTQTFRNPQRAQSIQATLVNRLHVNLASLQSTVVTSEKEKGRKWCDKPQTRLPHAIKSRQKKSKRERERNIVCFPRRSAVFGTVLGVGGSVAGKRTAFAHNPMTSLARGSFEKDTRNALSIPPSTVGVSKDCLAVFQRTNQQKARSQRLPSATFRRSLLAQRSFVAMPSRSA